MPHKPYKTQLIYVEGSNESAFIKYLRTYPYKEDIRHKENTDIRIKSKIYNAKGSNFQIVFDEALKRKQDERFDSLVIVMDYDWMGDIPPERERQLNILNKKAKSEGAVVLIVNKPCLEGLLLSILQNKDFSKQDGGCDPLKSCFEKNYLDKEKRQIPGNYTKPFQKNDKKQSFSRENIESARSIVKSLDLLIRAMQNEI